MSLSLQNFKAAGSVAHRGPSNAHRAVTLGGDHVLAGLQEQRPGKASGGKGQFLSGFLLAQSVNMRSTKE
eukprot:741772-Prorocentrum_lima.AAC.1